MDTKHKILLEALRLFSKRGYDAVSVEQIASAVGIKAPSLYISITRASRKFLMQYLK